MAKIAKKKKTESLYHAILALENLEECMAFFEDLCTGAELRAMEQRYEVARLLDKGMIYSEILEKTGASSATIIRVNRSLNNGSEGYHVVFQRLDAQPQEEEE